MLADSLVQQRTAEELKVGDMVRTFDANGTAIWTKVLKNQLEQQDFHFVKIAFDSGFLEVTESHEIIILDEAQKVSAEYNEFQEDASIVLRAGDVKVGDQLFTKAGWEQVQDVEFYIHDRKHYIATEAGTVLANGYLVTTSCANESDIAVVAE